MGDRGAFRLSVTILVVALGLAPIAAIALAILNR
jgi:hypothetical protein